MPGFGAYTHTYETRLHERPHWRKSTYCSKKSPLGQFAAKQDELYAVNAAKIRDARMRKSSAVDPNLALRRSRETILDRTTTMNEDEQRDYLSAALKQNFDKADLQGLRSRLGLQLTDTGGALSTGELKLTYNADKRKMDDVVSTKKPRLSDFDGGSINIESRHAAHRPTPLSRVPDCAAAAKAAVGAAKGAAHAAQAKANKVLRQAQNAERAQKSTLAFGAAREARAAAEQSASSAQSAIRSANTAAEKLQVPTYAEVASPQKKKKPRSPPMTDDFIRRRPQSPAKPTDSPGLKAAKNAKKVSQREIYNANERGRVGQDPNAMTPTVGRQTRSQTARARQSPGQNNQNVSQNMSPQPQTSSKTPSKSSGKKRRKAESQKRRRNKRNY